MGRTLSGILRRLRRSADRMGARPGDGRTGRAHDGHRPIPLHEDRGWRSPDPGSRPDGSWGTGPGSGYDGLADRAAQIFAPRHGETSRVRFRSVGPDGEFEEDSEVWHREQNAMEVIRTKNVLVTCSNAVVSADKIQGVCSVCGGYDDLVLRCAVCAAALCRAHGLSLRRPDGSAQLLCPEHLDRAVRSWDTWRAHDLQNGIPLAASVLPGKPTTSTEGSDGDQT